MLIAGIRAQLQLLLHSLSASLKRVIIVLASAVFSTVIREPTVLCLIILSRSKLFKVTEMSKKKFIKLVIRMDVLKTLNGIEKALKFILIPRP